MSVTCRTIEPLLDELADGTLDEARARAVRAHLRECVACAASFEAVDALKAAAADLGVVEPPVELWREITARLDVEDSRSERRSRLWWWWHAWRRTVFAGSGVLAAAAVAAALWVAGGRLPLAPTLADLPRPPVSAAALYDEAVADVTRAERDYAAAIDELRQVVAEERRGWSPEASRAFDENLAAIDAAIARQAEAFGQSPGNPVATDALHAMYRKKIDFLQEAVVRGSL
jgi:anti-sigma factor RsiW